MTSSIQASFSSPLNPSTQSQPLKPVNASAIKLQGVTKPKCKPIKKARKIVPIEANTAPSIGFLEDPTKLKAAIADHAESRIQIFYLYSLVYYKRCCRTDGTISDINVKIARASMQVGQGNRENHAAHPNASAGLQDNLKELMKGQIIKEGLTPIKYNLLKIKGLSDSVLADIDKRHNEPKFVESSINASWAHDSLLEETELEYILNMTNYLPAALNLGCDLPMEIWIRPYIRELIQHVAKNELDPKQATDKYAELIREHFTKKVEYLQNEISSCSNLEKLDRLQKSLLYHEMELEGSIDIDPAHLNKGFECVHNAQKIDSNLTLRLLTPR